MKKTVSYDKYMDEKLKDIDLVIAYLEGAVEDDDPQYLEIAVKRVIQANRRTAT